jgi:hypothetical protein
MNLQKSLQHISELMARFVQRVKSDNAMGLLDINRLGEDVLIPVFTEVYDYVDLVNLNAFGKNYPAIDLGDEVAGVAFQITSDASSPKIKDTLETFVRYKHYQRYNHLIIYIITEKQGSYAAAGWDEIVEGRFVFSKDKDVRDFSDLLQKIRHLPIEKVQRIEAILEQHFCNAQGISVKELIDKHLHRQLAREKNSRKYIPDIFVEVAKVKDETRFFAHPALFFQKALDDVARLEFGDVNRILRKISLEPVQLNWQYGLDSQVTIGGIYEHVASLSKALTQIRDVLYPYPYQNPNRPDDIDIPSNRKYIYQDMKYLLWRVASSVVFEIDELLENLRLMSSRILFIVGRAGQGKTNFVCNFAETVLAKRSIPCTFFTGREFNHIAPERIGEYIVKSIFGDRVGSLNDALDHLNKLAVESNAPVVIIIDGINEHRSIQAFSHHLERFVEEILEYNHIKLILTCRSEYFEERFSNFKQSGFVEEIRFIYNLEQYMSEMHKDQMIEGYFRFFNLHYPYMSQRAAKVLENDTLLLRMFCEAYGDVSAEREIQLPQIVDIYREKIFREYLERKIEGAVEYDEDSPRIRVRSGEKYRQVLEYIIQLMVQREQYTDIPIADLPTQYDDALGVLLGEDIIIRKDLISVDTAFSDRIEVINFTFDEFRDFLLAKHLVNAVFKQDRRKFEEIVDRIVTPESPVAEGIRTYLFFASRWPNGRDITEVISEKEWYRDIFIKSIFSVEEKFITQDDLDEIKTRFFENERNASWIIRMLVWRWRTSRYPQLNIRLLFEIFSELDEDAYERLVKPGFSDWGVYGFDGSRSWKIEQLTSNLREDLSSEDLLITDDFVNLMELLICFFPIKSRQSFSSPSFETYAKFAKLKPGVAITLLSKYTRVTHIGIRTQVWRMLTYIARADRIPTELVEEASQLLLQMSENAQLGSDSVAKEIVRFLETMAREKQLKYADPVVEQMRRHTLFPYGYEQHDDTGT